jgi:hypothetical protein
MFRLEEEGRRGERKWQEEEKGVDWKVQNAKMVTQRSRVHGSEPAHAAELQQRGFPFERFWNMIIRSLFFSAFPYFLSFLFFSKRRTRCAFMY